MEAWRISLLIIYFQSRGRLLRFHCNKCKLYLREKPCVLCVSTVDKAFARYDYYHGSIPSLVKCVNLIFVWLLCREIALILLRGF